MSVALIGSKSNKYKQPNMVRGNVVCIGETLWNMAARKSVDSEFHETPL